MTSVSNLSRYVGLAVARTEDIGKIVHELEFAGVRHTKDYETILRHRAPVMVTVGVETEEKR
jgi:hypothetical protein